MSHRLMLLLFLAGITLHGQPYQDLYNFTCSAGCTPYGRLVQGKNGNLYGTASTGGTNNLGTIFMVNTAGTSYTVLWNFDATTGAGGGGLTLASLDGNFYGTTLNTLYQFNPSTNAFTVMHTFASSEGVPQGPPVEAKDRNLYGVDGIHGENGTAYRFVVSSGTFGLLAHPIPGFPSGPLFLATDGYLYGASTNGGASQAGAIFRITTSGAVTKIYAFTDGIDGDAPNAPLAQGKDGHMYGTALLGGFFGDGKYGTIYQITLPSYGFTTEYEFDGSTGAVSNPTAGLLAASDGNLYGTTNLGGSDNLGDIFQFQLADSFIGLADFSGNGGSAPGASPDTALMEDTNGLFYGLTSAGGSQGGGVFYTVSPPNPLSHITLCCNWWVILDQPVTILGQNLSQVINVSFGSVQARFQHGSDSFLLAQVPSAAIDAPVTVTLATGLQLMTQQAARILPKITNLDPSGGRVGTTVNIVGGGFARAAQVSFGGVAASSFQVVSPSAIRATVPAGAQTGKVVVVTPNGSSASRQTFTVN